MTNQRACEVPLVELLKAVPIDARHAVETYAPLYSTTWHPVGAHCHRAAERLERFQEDYERLRQAAIAACSEMGCYCATDHEALPPEMRSALCRLGDLLSKQSHG